MACALKKMLKLAHQYLLYLNSLGIKNIAIENLAQHLQTKFEL